MLIENNKRAVEKNLVKNKFAFLCVYVGVCAYGSDSQKRTVHKTHLTL